MNKKKKKLIKVEYFVLLTILIIDQLTKAYVVANDVFFPVIGDFFTINYVANTGVAWSLLTGQKYLILLLNIAAMGLLLHFRKIQTNQTMKFLFSLMIAGGVGNIIDRVFRGYVVDFLDFNIFGYDFPVFNLADACLVSAVVFIMYHLMFKKDVIM